MATIFFAIALLSAVIWLFLLSFWGGFWRSQPILETQSLALDDTKRPLPSVCVVIPARNEADVLPETLRSLLAQDYAGDFNIILVDDHSTDGTATVAKETAIAINQAQRLTILPAEPLPTGWSGKLWAMDQGAKAAQAQHPDYILLTDADIWHDSTNLRRLMQLATQKQLDLASVMVRLRCESFWEKLLIPAFVFFFQKLYPFAWVNNPQNPTSGAAGGCILLRTEALAEIGGLACIREALIDDCSLAKQVKHRPWQQSPKPTKYHPIWLGLSDRTISLRPYDTLDTIWNMVARTAYTQLYYSPLLLVGTLVGMSLVYLVAPLALIIGVITGDLWLALSGLAGFLLMAIAYFPTVRFYHCNWLYSFCLPIIALFYTAMTFDSALRHWQGRGGAWKGRVYSS